MCEGCDRLVVLLRLVEGRVVPLGVLEDDAALDAWFGRRARPHLTTGVVSGAASAPNDGAQL